MRRRGVKWAITLSYAALILLVASIPAKEFPTSLPINFDKVAHVMEFFILAALACWAVERVEAGTLVLIACACIAYGFLTELYQGFIPGRFPSGWDGLANAVGSAVACTAWPCMRGEKARAERD